MSLRISYGAALLFICLSFALMKTATSFASKNLLNQNTDRGWKTRPSFPELGRQPGEGNNAQSKNEKVPWDGMRFLQQSSKFFTPPRLFQKKDEGTKVVNPGDTLWEPSSANNLFSFAPLDDVVMGGASKSNFDNETGNWRGFVTSANNGGFVGIRSTPFSQALDMKNCNGIELRLKGGNRKRFKFVVRDSTDFNGVCWTSSFDAPSLLNRVRLPFKKQVPTIFARTVPNQVFGSNNVLGFQVAYSKFEYDGDLNPNFSLGDFSLQIIEIVAC
mmetsp:Transcript_26123/g.38677  ORF Transcript_26123/g.38677 Transcript_26123/m.38677 type:complete len:273 (-) Transcript_26123:435-1253(-)|eukprot:CAMPEP_0195513130 /NCGR_PEP_ID=MMETSP0794_2-20130614/4857_1 /TAXON_ID=515487 /ORGANISM="Stephanopyxis turris, Strain CCMP 815" /LENGTH=272 /DNA_ID=CAMNT_0040641061 /DNA_START=91 /DNA_END=909 /DNA_ORIENTATION=-